MKKNLYIEKEKVNIKIPVNTTKMLSTKLFFQSCYDTMKTLSNILPNNFHPFFLYRRMFFNHFYYKDKLVTHMNKDCSQHIGATDEKPVYWGYSHRIYIPTCSVKIPRAQAKLLHKSAALVNHSQCSSIILAAPGHPSEDKFSPSTSTFGYCLYQGLCVFVTCQHSRWTPHSISEAGVEINQGNGVKDKGVYQVSLEYRILI